MAGLLDPGSTPDTQSSTSVPDNGTTTTPPSWISELPEPLRGEKSLHKFANRDEVAKSYVELQRKLGSSIQIPKSDADPAEWEKVFSHLRPESPDKYEVPTEGFTETAIADIKKAAFESGMTPTQVKNLTSVLSVEQKRQKEASETAIAAEITAATEVLKKEYGSEIEASLGIAKKALEVLFPGASKKLIGSGIDNNPEFIKGLVTLGKRLGEDSIVSGGPVKTKAQNADPYDWMNERFPKKD